MNERSFPKTIRRQLEATGLPWRLDARKKHVALIIDGEVASYISRGKLSSRTERNLKADIARYVKGLRYDKQRPMQNQDLR